MKRFLRTTGMCLAAILGAFVLLSMDKVCERCNGNKMIRCTFCGGGRTIVCPHCHGINPNCVKCGGKGYFDCERCKATGQITCTVCNGEGHNRCMTCDKKGYIEFRCPDCNGTGQLPDDETDN